MTDAPDFDPHDSPWMDLWVQEQRRKPLSEVLEPLENHAPVAPPTQ